MEWHGLSVNGVLKELKVSQKEGLNSKEVLSRQRVYGKNKLAEKKTNGPVKKFIAQFSDFMVIILLIAAVVSFITAIVEENGDFIDPIIILFIVILNAIMGVVQESKAEKAIQALQKMSAPMARVRRNGKEIKIDSENVVPGDILILDTGDFICADARLVEAYNLKTEESSLTGESLPVEKEANITVSEDSAIADRKNMIFANSAVTSGHAVAVVTQIGMNTQVGKIAGMINESESPQTPLQEKLAQTGKYLGIGAVIICFAIFVLGVIQKIPPLDMFMIAVSLAVAAIPEGLPAIVTIVLAIGVRRMAISRAIIRKLPAVETLGSASVICSDKTGTLTQNKMTVMEVWTANGKTNMSSKEGADILMYSALCNNSSLTGNEGNFKATGEPTETALVVAAANAGKVKNTLDAQYPRVAEFPFDSTRKLMTTIHKLGENRYRVVTKGAPDILLGLCSSCYCGGNKAYMSNIVIKNIQQYNQDIAERAMRVLSVAFKDIDYIPNCAADAEKELMFCGLIGMIDPPRPQAKQAVKECLSAGIRPVMITGDHIVTAKAIARELGILNDRDMAMTGSELEKMDQKELEKNINHYSVFARVSPEHKVRIVKAFQANGMIVAMTGDGVNDAPALKSANIGCAMGKSGTDVAKGAADMILTDDNFATIVEAVKQGRGIFENIKKTIHFLLSSNIGEIIAVLTAFLLKLPSPLLAIQLLWVNLITDSLPALALGVEPVDEDIMLRKPIDSKKGLFSGTMIYNIAIEGCYIGVITLLAFTIGNVFYDKGNIPVVGRTMAFAVLSISQLIHAFNVRSEKSILKTGIFGNLKMLYSFILCLILQISVISIQPVAEIFKTVGLSSSQWLIVSLLSISPLVIVEIEKYIFSFINKKRRA